MRQLFWCGSLCSIVALSSQLFAGKGGGGKPGGEDPPPAPYSMIDLGGFEGGTHIQSYANRLSNPDELGIVTVTGLSRSAGGDAQAAVWTAHPEVGVLSLDNLTPSSVFAIALDTNDNGWAIGYADDLGFLSIPGQPLIELPTLSNGSNWSQPAAISNANVIVGRGHVDIEVVINGEVIIETEAHGLFWPVDETGAVGEPIDLGTFQPYDVNEFGFMAGEVNDGSNSVAAVAEFDAAGELVVTVLTNDYSRAESVNDLGETVGWRFYISGQANRSEAFLWDANNGLQSLGFLPGHEDSRAYGINNQREIVGYSRDFLNSGGVETAAMIWRDGVMTDLNDLFDGGRDFYAWKAFDINDAGYIAFALSVSLPKNDLESHAGLLVPNPAQP